ncbi:2-phospho-L-lactate guanylyltransferase [Georgenia sunbinii]|uniref:2-phospho-L-lactate guanylyltransferase n=1 Tax=Georgenia sunbinii TaxID=3117728 RepID=UPI002F25F777
MTRPVTTAVVPLRDGSGKTRLADRFGAQQRSDLVAVLARHVVAALLDAGVVRDVLVVTRDPGFAAAALPADPRLTVVSQPVDRPGLNAAVDLGRRLAVVGGAGRLLMIHADLPLLDAADVRALLAPDAPLVLAPDDAGEGTNALVLDASVRGFAFRFGPGSRAAHAVHGAALGLRTAVVHRPGTATDLDTPADWARLPAATRETLSASSDRGGRRPRPASAAG